LACVPQTQFWYDAWPLFLIPQTLERATLLAGCMWIAALVQLQIVPFGDTSAAAYYAERFWVGQLSVPLVYLPCLSFILRPLPVAVPREDHAQSGGTPIADPVLD
jgi:hypothetical protein